MIYLKPYHLFESVSNPIDLMDVMKNTPEGRDLAAVAESYKVDRTGKIVLLGMRGKTFIQPQPDGSYKHWVFATGKTYGEGSGSTAEECIRDCWRQFILKSTTFRPQGYNMKEYEEKISGILHTFEGKALDTFDLQFEIRKILFDKPSNWNPIRDPKNLIDLPELEKAWDLLGLDLSKKPHSSGGFKSYIFDILEKDSRFYQMLNLPNIRDGFKISINTHSVWWNNNIKTFDGLEVKDSVYRIEVNVGGDLSETNDYSDKIIKGIISFFKKPRTERGANKYEELLANLAGGILELAMNGEDPEGPKMVDLVVNSIDDIDIILEFKSPLKEEVLKKKDFDDEEIKSLDAAKDFGLF